MSFRKKKISFVFSTLVSSTFYQGENEYQLLGKPSKLKITEAKASINKITSEMRYWSNIYFFRQIATFIKVRLAFGFGLQTLWLKDFSKIYRLKGLKPKTNGQTNFYECCDLTKNVYLIQPKFFVNRII